MRYAYFILIPLSFFSCRTIEKADHPIIWNLEDNYPLYEKTIIYNQEQNNNLEGHYLIIEKIIDSSTIQVNLPSNFYLYHQFKNWMMGYGDKKPFSDNGSENLFKIANIDSVQHIIQLGRRLTGVHAFHEGDRVVFFNETPSGFEKAIRVIEPSMFKNFKGDGIDFGTILKDSTTNRWYMYIQEVDTLNNGIYLASSNNLKEWQAENNGEPIFTNKSFEHTVWSYQSSKNKKLPCAKIYGSIQHKDTTYLFFDGWDSLGKRNIGLGYKAKSDINFTILPFPLLPLQEKYNNERGAFYCRIIASDGGFIMCYDGVSKSKKEMVCFAFSLDLRNWTHKEILPINDHHGWRNGFYTSEPSYFFEKNNYFFVQCGGYKKFNFDFVPEEFPLNFDIKPTDTSQRGMNVSGNVGDAQQGLYYMSKFNNQFVAHENNPIFINDYSDPEQDDHLGGNFYFNETNTEDIILYQAKSKTKNRYSVFYRSRPKRKN